MKRAGPATYTLTAGARLLGVSVSTLSRRLPATRVAQGRPARLSLDDLLAQAPALGVDPQDVRQRVAGTPQVDPRLPNSIRVWVQRAYDDGAPFPLAAYNARIPPDLLERAPDAAPGDDPVLRPRRPWAEGFRPMSYAELVSLLAADE